MRTAKEWSRSLGSTAPKALLPPDFSQPFLQGKSLKDREPRDGFAVSPRLGLVPGHEPYLSVWVCRPSMARGWFPVHRQLNKKPRLREGHKFVPRCPAC